MCNNAADECPFVFDSVPDQYKTHEMCDKVVSDGSFKFKYCHDWCKTQD